MWFLLIQIFFFMCVAAALGAALAWWWLRRRFVDVTETHAELTRQVETAIAEGRSLKVEDIDASLGSALAAYRPPLDPIEQRLSALEASLAGPDPEMHAIKDQLSGVEHALSNLTASMAALKSTELDLIAGQVRDVSARIDSLTNPEGDSLAGRLVALAGSVADNRPPDISPLQSKLDQLEDLIRGFSIPEVDLGPVHSSLARLDLTLSELQPPEINLAPLEDRLTQMEAQLGNLDPSEALKGLSGELGLVSAEVAHAAGELTTIGDAISRLDIPAPIDMTPVYNRLAEFDVNISDRIAQVETRLSATSPINEALVSTLAGIEADLDVVASRRGPDIEPMYAQLASLDASLATIRNELRGQTRLEAIDRRLASLQEVIMNPPAGDVSREDITALEDRLTSIEYGLSAVHHMLRSRSEGIRTDYEPHRGRSDASASRQEAREARTFQRTTRSMSTPEAPKRTARRMEAISQAHRPDDEANLLTHAAFGQGDDLARIIGVGPILTELLNEIGVYYFWQIAEWSEEDVAYVDEKLLHFRGRIERDDWVGQARELAAEPGAAQRPGEH